MPEGLTDKERYEFLQKLDDAPSIEVTDWEANFLESCLKWKDKGFSSDKQRSAVDRMYDKYREKLKL